MGRARRPAFSGGQQRHDEPFVGVGVVAVRVDQPSREVCGAVVVAGLALEPAIGAQSAGTVHGTVLDEAGIAVSGARVQITPLAGGQPSADIESGPDGRFRHTDVEAGLYAVSAVLIALLPSLLFLSLALYLLFKQQSRGVGIGRFFAIRAG